MSKKSTEIEGLLHAFYEKLEKTLNIPDVL